MRKAQIAVLLALAVAALPATAAERVMTRIPSDAATSDTQLWRQVMANFYGKYNKKEKCWIGTSSGQRYCMRPHTLHRVSAGKATHYYIAIGGHPMEAGNDCHNCSGTLGLLVLSDEKNKLGIVARNSGYEALGAWGKVPPEESFSVHRIGSPNTFAWTIETGWTGQGITTTALTIRGIIGDQVKDLGHVTSSFSDEGNCDNGINVMTQEQCTSVTFEPVYDLDGSGARFGTILLKGTGTWKGRPFDNTYRVNFDEASMTYTMPADFPEDFSP